MKTFLQIFLTISLSYLTLSGSFAQETPISLQTSTGEIKGTLTLPAKKTGIPIVLIIAGSGPTDRNCNSALGMESNAFKFLAEDLGKKGIASVRFDKRGVGESLHKDFKPTELRFDNYVDDVKGWIEMLGNDKRFSKIIVAGHSEGSLIGMIASTNNTKVKGFISIAGPGENISVTMKRQLSTQVGDMTVMVNEKLDSLKNGYLVANNIPTLEMIFNSAVQPYMISWCKYDPQNEIKKLNIPVAIIQGTTDMQVSVNDAELLAQACPLGKKIIIKNMNHPLKDCETLDPMANWALYSKPDLPLNKEFVKEMIGFIKSIK